MLDSTLKLNRAERLFLARHAIPEEYVADMRERAHWVSCGDELRAVGRYLAWGFRKCALGHRITNGKGRCIQCHPATIAFVLRHARPGWLYIAVADDRRLTKVGIGADVEERLRQLNAHRLAGVESWRAVHVEWCANPAALEAELHRRLADRRQDAVYERKGGAISRETFACSAAEAIAALADLYAERPDW